MIGDEVRAGPDLFFRQQDDGAARHPGAVHLGDAAVVSQRRRQRGRIHAREEIEVIGVAQSEVHVTRVRAFHALGHPRRPARVEDGRQALRGVIQPVRWRSRGLSLRQRHDVQGRQAAERVRSLGENDHGTSVLQHVADQRVGQGRIEEHEGPPSLENAEMGGHDLPVVLWHRHGHDLVGAREEGRNGPGHLLRSPFELGEGQGFPGVRNLQGREIGKPRGGAREDLCEPPDSLLMRHAEEAAFVKTLREAKRGGVRRRRCCPPAVHSPGHEAQNEDDRNRGDDRHD